MLACLNHHAYIVFEVVFSLIDDSFVPGIVICWFVYSWQLLAITIITAYLITRNGHAPR